MPPDASDTAGAPILALTTDEHAAEKSDTERKPTPLALAPQSQPIPFDPALLSAKAECGRKAFLRKHASMLKGLFISGGMVATLAFALSGLWRGLDQNSAAASPHSAEAAAPKLVNHAQSHKISVSANPAGTAPQAIAAVKPATLARKPVSSVPPRPEKVAKRKTVEQIGKHAAEDSQKQSAENIAKAPVKPPAKLQHPTRFEQDGILLASKTPNAPDRFAQCLELSSFLRREQCKWQVCNGKWGQDGCPSYSSDHLESN